MKRNDAEYETSFLRLEKFLRLGSLKNSFLDSNYIEVLRLNLKFKINRIKF